MKKIITAKEAVEMTLKSATTIEKIMTEIDLRIKKRAEEGANQLVYNPDGQAFTYGETRKRIREDLILIGYAVEDNGTKLTITW
jgi:hypothetical protein